MYGLVCLNACLVSVRLPGPCQDRLYSCTAILLLCEDVTVAGSYFLVDKNWFYSGCTGLTGWLAARQAVIGRKVEETGFVSVCRSGLLV